MSVHAELLLEQWGAWSRGDVGLGLTAVGSDSIEIIVAESELLKLDGDIARLSQEKPFLGKVIRIKYLKPELGENGEAVPRSDMVVGAMLRKTQTEISEALGDAMRWLEAQ